MNYKIETKIKFGFIGCGLIGNKRAKFLKNSSIIGCFDQDQSKAELFSKKFLPEVIAPKILLNDSSEDFLKFSIPEESRFRLRLFSFL